MERPIPCRQETEPVRKRKRKRRRRCKRHPPEGPHSPTCRGSRGQKATNPTNAPALVRILPRLRPILDFLGVRGDIFTRAQIIGHLTEYIKKKALYDPVDPRKVYCENDELGDIFGCKEFSTANVCELLLQNLENVPPQTNILEPHCSKRARSNFPCPPTPLTSVSTTDTCSCSESDQQLSDIPSTSRMLSPWSPGVKRSYGSAFPEHITILPSESSTSGTKVIDSTVSTEYFKHYNSICGNATDIVTDTSDDLFFLYETEEEHVVQQVVESDVSVVEITDGENVYSNEDGFAEEYEPISFSDEERLLALHRFDQVKADSDDTEVDEGEDGGDELDNNDTSDSEIEEEDKWQCQSCPERNHPMTRRCRRCWVVRQDWFATSLNRTQSDPGRIRNETAQAPDQATVSDSASTSHAPSASTSHAPSASTSHAPSASTSHAPNEATGNAPHASVPVNEPSDSTASESKDGYGRMKCMVCRKKPPNGCIVHGGTGHQVCCVECARKLKDNNRPCPVCRKKIGKVIQNFM